MSKDQATTGNRHSRRLIERLPQSEVQVMSKVEVARRGSFVLPGEQAGGLAFSEIRANDYLLIYTRNSFYSFLVTDAAEMRGTLAGGAHLGGGSDAVLLGAIVKRSQSKFLTERTRLQADSRALFVVDAGEGVRKLMTSTITRLICLRSRAAE